MSRDDEIPGRPELDEIWFGEYGDYDAGGKAIAEADRVARRRGWSIRRYDYNEQMTRMRETGQNCCCEVTDDDAQVRAFRNYKTAIYSLMYERLDDAPDQLAWNHCGECGKEFTVVEEHQLSCSDACEAVRKARTAMPEHKKGRR